MKEHYLNFERNFLSEHAMKSEQTRGRQKALLPCSMRTEFQRDRDRILHSKSFRRLKRKTQVFLSPNGDHFRTRLTHTLEVTQIARTISRALLLSEDLTEAIALGHDLGHTPFGHMGERVLEKKTGHFLHNEQSLRVVDIIEDLNLTYEVRNGILNHTSEGNPETLEGKVVAIADRIAYLNHDIDDAIRAGVLTAKDIPRHCTNKLGIKRGEMINTLVFDIIKESFGKPMILQSEDIKSAMDDFRKFMFEMVYINPKAKWQEKKAEKLLSLTFDYFLEHPNEVPEFYRSLSDKKEIFVTDYIAGMSDDYAIELFKKLYLPV
ncbi:MAG: deoxyguanosinetriphosphate triphosphohydrolase [Firmicutes bacterium]|nr:deoxyguanosinetriphosphate triphosphohydrolase [Bacillota bacterium]